MNKAYFRWLMNGFFLLFYMVVGLVALVIVLGVVICIKPLKWVGWLGEFLDEEFVAVAHDIEKWGCNGMRNVLKGK